MTSEQLRELWITALRASRLPVHGAYDIDETLDARTLDRTVSSIVASPVRAEPFMATATLAWRWTALHTARTVTTEEDLLAEVLGRDHATPSRTQPQLRLDISLRATPRWAPPELPRGDALLAELEHLHVHRTMRRAPHRHFAVAARHELDGAATEARIATRSETVKPQIPAFAPRAAAPP